jgi:hypothetical protein
MAANPGGRARAPTTAAEGHGWPAVAAVPAASVLLPLSLMPVATPLAALQPLVFPEALVAAAAAAPFRAPPGRAVPLARPPAFPPGLPRRRPRPEDDEEEEEEEEEEGDEEEEDVDDNNSHHHHHARDHDTLPDGPPVGAHAERRRGHVDPREMLGGYPGVLPYGDARMDATDLDVDVAEVMAVRARHPDGPWERIDVRQAAQRRRALRRMNPTQRDYFLCGVVAMMEAAEYAQSRRLQRRRRLHQYVRYHYDCGTPIARELFLDLWGFGRKYFSRIRRMVRDLGAGPASSSSSAAAAAAAAASTSGRLHRHHDDRGSSVVYDPHPADTAGPGSALAAAVLAAGLEATMPRMPDRSHPAPGSSATAISGGGGGATGTSESTWDAPP